MWNPQNQLPVTKNIVYEQVLLTADYKIIGGAQKSLLFLVQQPQKHCTGDISLNSSPKFMILDALEPQNSAAGHGHA